MAIKDFRQELEQARALVSNLRKKLAKMSPEIRRQREQAWEAEEAWPQDTSLVNTLAVARDLVREIDNTQGNRKKIGPLYGN